MYTPFRADAPQPLTIQLTNDDLLDARSIARLRTRGKDLRKIANYSGRTHEQNHYYGAVGEIAVEKAIGISMDREWRRFGDLNDFTLPNGETISVRHRVPIRHDFALYGPNLDELKENICLLTWGLDEEKKTIELAGVCSRTFFEKNMKLGDFKLPGDTRPQPRLYVPYWKMGNVRKFLAYVKEVEDNPLTKRYS